ncbi:MAG TPA: sodium-translocating pyrophosphatase [Chloroflexota bacterium]|nr:sodium-translocating pyrophosphatase [Chloroflexota bacterium]
MDLALVIPIAGIVAVLFAMYLAWDVLRRDTGTKAMQEVGGMIFEGATAFLRRQYQTIAMIAIVAAILVGAVLGGITGDSSLGVKTAIAFLVGAAASALSGIIGMYVAVQSNVRTAAAAQRSLNEAITVSLRGGAVSGFLIVALSLLGVAGIYYLYGHDPISTPATIVGFGFGASFVALFAQLGGGIYTKAADMGADLVGKVEAGIPEDDPRNAAVIADLVGDNVGDCAGRGADLFESTAAENIGAMILGVAIATRTGHAEWVLFPLIVRAFGVFATMIGLLCVPLWGRINRDPDQDPMNALNFGYFIAVGLATLMLFYVTTTELHAVVFFWAGLVGIVTSIAIVFITQFYTAGSWRPVREIADAAQTGPATVIVMGVAVGFETTASTAVAVGIALLAAYGLGSQAAAVVPVAAGQPPLSPAEGGLFGTAVATMGMLMTAAYVLAMDTFGPITDNANGVIEMAGAGGQARDITDRLDAVGNTTKALTKGYAMASAALAAFLLFGAYGDTVREGVCRKLGQPLTTCTYNFSVDLTRVEIFVAALLAVMLVFLFSSLAIRAVSKAASAIIEEVRRQFREEPGIMAGSVRPDYGRAVDITTRAGLREMIAPGMLPIFASLVVGLLFKALHLDAPEAVGALLMVGTIAGIILATVLNNGGGAWDNAKKYIEAGHLRDVGGGVLGKGTQAHAAAVVGDTVGDPFKDTAGPSLHVLVKLLSTITLVLAPLFI